MTSRASVQSSTPRRTFPDKEKGTGRKFSPLAVLARVKGKSSDVLLAGLGVSLGLVCALFPWYIFMNQDKFGVQAMRFQGENSGRPGLHTLNRPSSQQSVSAGEMPAMGIDFLATATPSERSSGERRTAAEESQPFPVSPPDFFLVHVANGRAMIRDDGGLWVVQPGSRLPDGSRASSIERREGQWVLVTSRDHILTIDN